MSITEQLKIIEQNHLGHFAFLPKKLEFNVEETHGITVINCGLQTSMFNIVYGAPKDLEFSNSIQEIKEIFDGEPFAWWVPPTQHNLEFTKILL